MFWPLSLALGIAVLDCVAARRLKLHSVADEVLSESKQAVSSRVEAEDAVKTLVVRACVLELLDKFEEEGKRLQVNMSGDGALHDALKKQWALEDELWKPFGGALKKIIRKFNSTLEAARTNVKLWGFSVDRATEACEERQGEVFQQCISTLASEQDKNAMTWEGPPATLKIRKRVFYESLSEDEKSCEGVDCGQLNKLIAEGDLSMLLKLLWQSEEALLPIHTITTRAYRANPQVAPQIDIALRNKAITKKAVNKAFGFSTSRAKKICAKKLESDSFGVFGQVVQHALSEMTESVSLDAGVCHEIEGTTCPEGHSPQIKRDLAKTMFKAFLAAQVGSQELVVSLSFLTGLVHPSIAVATASTFGLPLPAMATGSHLGAALTMVGFSYVLPFSSVVIGLITAGAGVYAMAFPSCRCYADDWKYSSELAACEIQAKGNSTNQYHWLPYPGQKIVASDSKCSVQECNDDDFSAPSAHNRIFGKVGHASGVLYNCLSSTGFRSGALMGNRNLEMLPEEKADDDVLVHPSNNPQNRQRVYSLLEGLDSLRKPPETDRS